MRTTVSSIRFKASDELNAFAEKEVQRLLKYSEDIINCEVQMSYSKSEKRANVNVNVNGTILNATEVTDDFMKSMVLAVDKLERQIRKLKGKIQAKH